MANSVEATAGFLNGEPHTHAVEQSAGKAEHGDHHPTACLNCGTSLIGSHCHACGQAGHVHRTAGAIFHDIAHGVFHFEGKAWETLPMLIRRPGELTRRYIDGERARFVSPLAIFLFTVFFMFATVANLPGWSLADGDFLKSGLTEGVAETRAKVIEERERADQQLAMYREALNTARAKPSPNAERTAKLERNLADTAEMRQSLIEAEKRLPIMTTLKATNDGKPVKTNWFYDKFRHAQENPKLLLYKLKTSAYKYSWALIPLSIPIMWLLFPFSRRFKLYDHAVFITYSLTFMSLLTIALAVLQAVGVPFVIVVAAAVLVPPFHIYRQLKGTYQLGRTNALVRAGLLIGLIYCAVVPAFAVMLLYLGLA